MRCDVLRRRAIVAQNRLFSILSDVVRLVAVGGDAMQNYIAMLASFDMTSHCVAGPCDDLRHCELGFIKHVSRSHKISMWLALHELIVSSPQGPCLFHWRPLVAAVFGCIVKVSSHCSVAS